MSLSIPSLLNAVPFRIDCATWNSFTPRHVKNANIFVDVDLTLVDANGKLEGEDALRLLHDEGVICSSGLRLGRIIVGRWPTSTG